MIDTGRCYVLSGLHGLNIKYELSELFLRVVVGGWVPVKLELIIV